MQETIEFVYIKYKSIFPCFMKISLFKIYNLTLFFSWFSDDFAGRSGAGNWFNLSSSVSHQPVDRSSLIWDVKTPPAAPFAQSPKAPLSWALIGSKI